MNIQEAVLVFPTAGPETNRWITTTEKRVSRTPARSVEAFKSFTLVRYVSADLVYDDLGICGAVTWFKRPELRGPYLTPSSGFLARARRQGLAYHLYEDRLAKGMVLVSDVAQSRSANLLWKKLGLRYPWTLIKIVEDRALNVAPDRAGDPDVRLAVARTDTALKRLTR